MYMYMLVSGSHKNAPLGHVHVHGYKQRVKFITYFSRIIYMHMYMYNSHYAMCKLRMYVRTIAGGKTQFHQQNKKVTIEYNSLCIHDHAFCIYTCTCTHVHMFTALLYSIEACTHPQLWTYTRLHVTRASKWSYSRKSWTGFKPTISGLHGQCSNPLN